MENNTILHIFMKFKGIDDNGRNVYKEHINILEEFGTVWWGNFGRNIRPEMKYHFVHQLDNKIPTFCFLYGNYNRNLKDQFNKWYIGNIVDISTDYPSDSHLIPDYYRNIKCASYLKFDKLVSFNNKGLHPRPIQNSLLYLYFEGKNEFENLTILNSKRTLFE